LLDALVVAGAAYDVECTFDRVHLLEFRLDADGTRRWHRLDDMALAPASIIGRGSLDLSLTIQEHRGLVEIVARRSKQVIGRAALWAPTSRLLSVEVDEAERRTGVGAHLLAAAELEMARRGHVVLTGDDHPFLRRHGWSDGSTGVQPQLQRQLQPRQ
jgi:GNAT superfamily N-acetyltransferase